MTVEELYNACGEQIKKGNGKKQVWLSDDDEGNGYHQCYYEFTDDEKEITTIQSYTYGRILDVKAKDIVILG